MNTVPLSVAEHMQEPLASLRLQGHNQTQTYNRSQQTPNQGSSIVQGPSSYFSSNPTYTQRIGPYVISKTLGVGSTGHVKLGTHLQTGETVAVKIITKKQFNDTGRSPEKNASLKKKMEREITIMKLIQHDNVLRLFDVYESENELILILEHVEGGELFDYIVKKGRLTEEESLNFFQQIILGMNHSHNHLICHRDLKPENLLLDSKNNIKIADFGMANLQIPGRFLETSCGSPHYASPEIIKGIQYDGPTSDVWSCGVILYALITGNLPFDDDNIRKLLSKVKSGLFSIPSYVCPGVQDLIKRMLTVDPSKRISIKEIIKHPWFTSRPLKMSGEYIPSSIPSYIPSSIDSLPHLNIFFSLDMLDKDILRAMALLGWENEDQLVTALNTKSPETPEKTFYNLLLHRKNENMSGVDVDRFHIWDIEGGPKRRIESFGSMHSTPIKIAPQTPSTPNARAQTRANPSQATFNSVHSVLTNTAPPIPTQISQNKPVFQPDSDTKELPASLANTGYAKRWIPGFMQLSPAKDSSRTPSVNKQAKSVSNYTSSDSTLDIQKKSSWLTTFFHQPKPEIVVLHLKSPISAENNVHRSLNSSPWQSMGAILQTMEIMFQEKIENGRVVSYKCKFVEKEDVLSHHVSSTSSQTRLTSRTAQSANPNTRYSGQNSYYPSVHTASSKQRPETSQESLKFRINFVSELIQSPSSHDVQHIHCIHQQGPLTLFAEKVKELEKRLRLWA